MKTNFLKLSKYKIQQVKLKILFLVVMIEISRHKNVIQVILLLNSCMKNQKMNNKIMCKINFVLSLLVINNYT